MAYTDGKADVNQILFGTRHTQTVLKHTEDTTVLFSLWDMIWRCHECLGRFLEQHNKNLLTYLFEPIPELCRPWATALHLAEDMGLLEARDAGQNQSSWRLLASYSTMHS